MGLAVLGFAAGVGWLIVWIAISIVYRRGAGKPLFPRAPDGAVFSEAWISGRSLRNVLTRIGGASNCLLVYVADGALTIVPVFPFNLMFLPEIYGLETTVSISHVNATEVDGLFGKRLLLTVAGFQNGASSCGCATRKVSETHLRGEPLLRSDPPARLARVGIA